MNWRRIDLHIHTPASSSCYKDKATYLQILQKAEEKGLDIIAITDHNTISGYAGMVREIEQLELLERLGRLNEQETIELSEYRRLRSKILVLPGFEFTATFGFHVLGIFPETISLRHIEHLLLGLGIPEEKLDHGSSEVGATSDVITAYRAMAEAGGIVIAAHANSSNGVAMLDRDFGGQTRIAFTQDKNLHALEVTDLDSRSRRSTAAFFSGSRPGYPRRMICIQGSDAHLINRSATRQDLLGVGDRVTEVLLDDVSFEGLRDIFLSNHFSRVRPYRPVTETPFDFIQTARKEGPNLVQSFYEYYPAKTTKREQVYQDVVAFANGNGGTVFLGVSANPKQAIHGIEKPEEVVKQIVSEIQRNVTPPIDVNVESKSSDSKHVVIVEVPQGSDTPYAFGGGMIYVRQESETSLAQRDEIVRLVLKTGKTPASVQEESTTPEGEVVEGETVEAGVLSVEPPKTGAEIVEVTDRSGVRYYGIRDLRNGSIVRNVTRFSARHLWHYAITQAEDNPLNESEISWNGEIGLWKSYSRMGTRRYNFVQRNGNGKIHIYYGVTDEGIHGPWRELIPDKEA